MWKRLNSNQMCEKCSYKEVFLIKRFLIERFYCIYRGVEGGGGVGGAGVSDPPPFKNMAGAKYVLLPPMKCVLINCMYIRSSIL